MHSVFIRKSKKLEGEQTRNGTDSGSLDTNKPSLSKKLEE